ncbi:Gfo/Idh/MocA family protein [Oceanobacillus chungangensis]|uniref:Gfo/Idh/MocA family protein n=1 Tax=Oceanobacillus chungangensis TaxID=1229152 RepID=UPI001FEAF068|nr:Gfo/Idh/MocA family oxidoreductase [Oceanobacillus chungangensis]
MKQIQFGIIGAGILAPLHANAIYSNPRAMLAAIVDIDLEKADKLAKEFNIEKVFTDYEKMLLEPIDVVCLCVPSGMHAALAVKCAEMGKHVLTEKPLDITFEHMDEMINACNNSGVKLGAVFQRRTLPHFLAAKNTFDSGAIGDLMMIQAYLKYFRSDEYYASAGWRGKWKLDGGGALMNQGVHGIDLMQWIGGEIESVMAYTATLARKNIEVEDTAVAVLKFKNGALGTIQGATSVFPEQETSIELNGNKGTLKVSDTNVEIWEVIDNENSKPALPASDHDGHAIIINDMVDAVIDDREPMITGVEARKSVEIILAIYESAKIGREIKLSEFHPFSS